MDRTRQTLASFSNRKACLLLRTESGRCNLDKPLKLSKCRSELTHVGDLSDGLSGFCDVSQGYYTTLTTSYDSTGRLISLLRRLTKVSHNRTTDRSFATSYIGILRSRSVLRGYRTTLTMSYDGIADAMAPQSTSASLPISANEIGLKARKFRERRFVH